jgi:hypothetical protein
MELAFIERGGGQRVDLFVAVSIPVLENVLPSREWH